MHKSIHEWILIDVAVNWYKITVEAKQSILQNLRGQRGEMYQAAAEVFLFPYGALEMCLPRKMPWGYHWMCGGDIVARVLKKVLF